MEVSNVWFDLLTSESFMKLGITQYYKEIVDELWSAVLENHVNKVRRIISITNIDVNFRKKYFKRVRCVDRDVILLHITPLWLASMRGFSDVVKLLLQAGADANHVCHHSGWSLLHEVVTKERKIVVQLLDGGADINRQDSAGVTPLIEACRHNKPKVVKLLLDKGADLNLATNNIGKTPLHYAVDYGSATMVKYLLARGAEINTRDEEGATPLTYALRSRYMGSTGGTWATPRVGVGVGEVARLLKYFGGTR